MRNYKNIRISSKIVIFFLFVFLLSLASAADLDLATGKPSPTSKARALNNQLVQEAYAQSQVLSSSFAYTYDNVGNRLTESVFQNSLPKNLAYAYDNLYQLTGVTGSQTHSYTYDATGNRTLVDSTVYIPNPLNQYQDVGGTPYSYDPNGNLTSDGINTYTYDYENRLIQVTGPGVNVRYTYDGFGRRIKKEVNGVVTYFLHDGDQVIEERGSGGVLKATYTYGPGIDEVLTMNRNAQTFFYFYDGLGSVTDLTNAQGEVVESYSYDPYGLPTQPSSVGNPYLYTGREYDSETNLYYYRSRFYHPGIGRFMQRDVFGGGDENLYAYVENRPINFVDPHGEFTLAPQIHPGQFGPGITLPPGVGSIPGLSGDKKGKGVNTSAEQAANFAKTGEDKEKDKKPGEKEKGKRLKDRIRHLIRDITKNPKDWEKIAEKRDPKQPKGGDSTRELWRNKQTGELVERHRKTPDPTGHHPHYGPVEHF